MIWASCKGHDEIVDELLDNEADVDLQDEVDISCEPLPVMLYMTFAICCVIICFVFLSPARINMI